jgi:hypothetical protein
MKRRKKVSSIRYPNGKVIDIIELKGRNGKRTLKMQPRRSSLKETEKIILGHTIEGKGLDHFNGYQKTRGKILSYDVSLKPAEYRPLHLTQKPVTLQSGEKILGIYGESLPPSILVNRSGTIYHSGASGATIYVGSANSYSMDY